VCSGERNGEDWGEVACVDSGHAVGNKKSKTNWGGGGGGRRENLRVHVCPERVELMLCKGRFVFTCVGP
jgi:hypothetical protein